MVSKTASRVAVLSNMSVKKEILVANRTFTEHELDAALELASSGANTATVAGSLGLNTYGFLKYCEKHPNFARLFQQHREVGFLARAESLPDAIKFGVFNDSNHLRVFVDTEKWLLSKLHQKVFGDKQTVVHEYPDVQSALNDARARSKTIDVTPQAKPISGSYDTSADSE